MQLQIGDHLATDRTLYDHHGIYIGQGQVVHYSGLASGLSKGAVGITSLEQFADGQGLKILKTQTPYSRQEIADRALSRVDEDKYNLVFNNCEHFANWCRTGKSSSAQVQSVVRVSASALATYFSLAASASASTTKPIMHAALFKTAGVLSSTPYAATPVVAKALASAVPATSLAGSIAGITAGGGTAAGLMASAATATAGLTAAPVLVPLAVAAGVGVGIKSLVDWIWD